jgi:beta-mannosidase
MPLQGSYKGARSQAVRQAVAAVDLLGHHPSIVVWCGHDRPFGAPAPGGQVRGASASLRWMAAQALPSWNKTVLDRSVRRALDKADPSRPAVAQSGRLPHPAGGTDSHLYYGWRRGGVGDLARLAALWPAVTRFVSELGAQAVPPTAAFMTPESWPDLDWATLVAHHGLRKDLLDERVPPGRYPTFPAWQEATQAYQAGVVKAQVEALRRLEFRPVGGFAVFCLNDVQPAVSFALLDHERRPKAAYAALRAACAPVIVVSDWLADSYLPSAHLAVDVHVVNDGHETLPGEVEAVMTWPGGGRRWRFGGDAAGKACSFVGRLRASLPDRDTLRAAGPPDGGEAWPLVLELRLVGANGTEMAGNRYESQIRA